MQGPEDGREQGMARRARRHDAILSAGSGLGSGCGPAHGFLGHGGGGFSLTWVVGPGLDDAAGPSSPFSDQGIEVGQEPGRQIELGEALRERPCNARFEQADAQIYPFAAATFDVAISRTGAMFFGDPVAAFRNIARALRPAGRLTLLAWQALPRNEWIREFFTALAAGRELPTPPPDAPGPFSLADPARVRSVLTAAGFTDVQLQGLSAPLYFGPDTEAASRFVLGVTGWMLEGLDERGRTRALDALRATIADHDTGHGVTYDSAAWIITACKS
jgi:SAM-dependent methyltransferase